MFEKSLSTKYKNDQVLASKQWLSGGQAAVWVSVGAGVSGEERLDRQW